MSNENKIGSNILRGLSEIAHSPIRNYAAIGLTSRLCGAIHEDGSCVRLLSSSWDYHGGDITPHSHKSDLHCTVLVGRVHNRIWTLNEDPNNAPIDNYYSVSVLLGALGNYVIKRDARRDYFQACVTTYEAGESYFMPSTTIHSIHIEKGTTVLMVQGPAGDKSWFLEPIVNGEVVETLKVHPWMFSKD